MWKRFLKFLEECDNNRWYNQPSDIGVTVDYNSYVRSRCIDRTPSYNNYNYAAFIQYIEVDGKYKEAWAI